MRRYSSRAAHQYRRGGGQRLLGHESLDTSQGYIDATANLTRQAARANQTYQTLQQLALD